MKKIILLMFMCFCTFVLVAQTHKIAQVKSDRIFSYYQHSHIPYSGNKFHMSIGDSVLVMLNNDIWFENLPIKVQHGKKFRVLYYQSKAVGKYQKNKIYLHTWINRIYSTDVIK